jgi:hypothetical protein
MLFMSTKLPAQQSFNGELKASDSHAAKTSIFNVIVSKIDTSNLKFTFVVNNFSGKKSFINLDGPNGHLYYRAFDSGAFTLTFDFSVAEDGVYYLEVECGREKVIKALTIHTERPMFRKIQLD